MTATVESYDNQFRTDLGLIRTNTDLIFSFMEKFFAGSTNVQWARYVSQQVVQS